MLKVAFLGPLCAGIWFMYKGVRDTDAWRSVRAAWFITGLCLFSAGIALTFVAAGQALVEFSRTADDEPREPVALTPTMEPPPVFSNFSAGHPASVPQSWEDQSSQPNESLEINK